MLCKILGRNKFFSFKNIFRANIKFTNSQIIASSMSIINKEI